MSQLKARIARIEAKNNLDDSDALVAFGGHLLLQDFEIQETDDGEVLEVPKGELRREWVMYPDSPKPRPGVRVMGFEPFMTTQAEIKVVLESVMNKSRSI